MLFQLRPSNSVISEQGSSAHNPLVFYKWDVSFHFGKGLPSGDQVLVMDLCLIHVPRLSRSRLWQKSQKTQCWFSLLFSASPPHSTHDWLNPFKPPNSLLVSWSPGQVQYFYSTNQDYLKPFTHFWGCYCLNGTTPSQGGSLWEGKRREKGKDTSVSSIKWHTAKHEISSWEQQPMWQPAVVFSLGLFFLRAMLPASPPTSLTVTSGSTCTHSSLWKSVSATRERGFSFLIALFWG